MSRTLLFFLLATFLWVSNSESFLSQIGLARKEVPDTGLDAATDRGKVIDDGSGNGNGGGHGDSNGKGHEQHGNGLGKGHGGSGTPVDCEVGSWSSWGGCSKTCGGGTYTRHRDVTVQPSNGGQGCPDTTDEKPCNTQSCGGGPVDCECGSWSPWSTCSKTCGTGSQHRERGVTREARNGGRGCPALSESQDCNTQSCGGGPVDCQCGSWSPWSSCSANCGRGSQHRERSITVAARNGGRGCPSLSESQDCNTNSCSGGGDEGGGHGGGDQDCEVSSWSPWGSCSKACGGGKKSRTCSITKRPSGRGRPCPSLTETDSCNTRKC